MLLETREYRRNLNSTSPSTFKRPRLKNTFSSKDQRLQAVHELSRKLVPVEALVSPTVGPCFRSLRESPCSASSLDFLC